MPPPGPFDDLKRPKPPNALGKVVLGVQVPPLPPVHARGRRATETGLAPPAPGSAPLPPPVASLPPPPAYKRSVSPIPWDDRPEARREAERHGDRVVEHPVSVPPPVTRGMPPTSSVPPSREPRWYHTAKGTIAVVGALSVAIPATVTGTTAAVVSVINALRQPTDPKLREDVEGTRKELAALRTYLADKDTARALELEKRLDAFNARLVDLDLRYPAQKVDVLRPPAK